jgi:hypothetical protein
VSLSDIYLSIFTLILSVVSTGLSLFLVSKRDDKYYYVIPIIFFVFGQILLFISGITNSRYIIFGYREYWGLAIAFLLSGAVSISINLVIKEKIRK